MRSCFAHALAAILLAALPLATPCRAAGPSPCVAYWQAEAEDGVLSDAMAVYQDPEASGGLYVATPTNLDGAVSYSVSVPTTAYYYLWARAKGASWVGDTFAVAIDEALPFVWAIPQVGGRWDWGWSIVNEAAQSGHSIQLTAGQHTLTFRGREADAALDRLVLSDSAQSPEDRPTVPNDLIENASWIGTLPYTWTQHIAAATSSPSDPSLSDPYTGGALSVDRTVWLRYSPTADEILSVDAGDTPFDVVVAIFEDAPEGLVEMDMGSRIAAHGSGIASTPVSAGLDYYVMSSGSPTPEEDTLSLRLAALSPEALPWQGITSTARDLWFLLDAPQDCETLDWQARLEHAAGDSVAFAFRTYDVLAQRYLERSHLLDSDCMRAIQTQSGRPLLIGCKLGACSGWDQWQIEAATQPTALQADDFSAWPSDDPAASPWERVDPEGAGTFANEQLGPSYVSYQAISVAAGTHTLADGNAPRMLQPTCEEPLAAQVEISLPNAQAGDHGGLVVWADAENRVAATLADDGTLRLERALDGVHSESSPLDPSDVLSATLGLWREGDIVGISLTPYGAGAPTRQESVYWPQTAIPLGAAPLRLGLFAGNNGAPAETTLLFAAFEPRTSLAAADPFAAPVPLLTANHAVSDSTAGFGVTAWLSHYGGCPLDASGPEQVYAFDAPLDAVYAVELSPTGTTPADLHVFVLDASRLPSRCLAWGTSPVPFSGTRKARYYLVVDGESGEAGGFTLTVHGDAHQAFVALVER